MRNYGSKFLILLLGASLSLMAVADTVLKKEGWHSKQVYSIASFNTAPTQTPLLALFSGSFIVAAAPVLCAPSNRGYESAKALAKHNKDEKYQKPLIALSVANTLNTAVHERYCYRNI